MRRNQTQDNLKRRRTRRSQSGRLRTAWALILLLVAVSVGELSRAQSQDQQIQLIINESNIAVTQENGRTVMTIDLIQEIQRQQPTLFAPGQAKFDLKNVGIEAKTRVGGGQVLLLVEGNEGARYVDLQRVETDPDFYDSKDGYQKIELANSEPEIRKAQLILLNPMRIRGLRVTLGSLRLLQVAGVYGDFAASKWTPATAPAITPLPQKTVVAEAKPDSKPDSKVESKPVEQKPPQTPAPAQATQTPLPKVAAAPEAPKPGPVGQSAVVRVPPPVNSQVQPLPTVPAPVAPVAVPRPTVPVAPPAAPAVKTTPVPNHSLPSASERPPAPVVAPRPVKPPPEKRAVTPQVRCLDGICIGMKVYHRRTYWEGRVIGIDIRRHTMVVRFGESDEIFDASVSTRDLERIED